MEVGKHRWLHAGDTLVAAGRGADLLLLHVARGEHVQKEG